MCLVYLRVWCLTASIPAFQAGGEGSNPFTRSNSELCCVIKKFGIAVTRWCEFGTSWDWIYTIIKIKIHYSLLRHSHKYLGVAQFGRARHLGC